jgi:hypothetical protein
MSFVEEECKSGKGIDEVRDKAHDKAWGNAVDYSKSPILSDAFTLLLARR